MKFATLILALLPVLAKADTLCADLTTNGAFGTCNGALFLQIAARPTGSGVIDPFVRLDTNNPINDGYNTDARPYAANNDAQTTGTFDHSELESLIALAMGGQVVNGVTLPGSSSQQYLELELDINQTGAHPLLSLDQLAVFFTNTGTDNPAITLDGSGNPIMPAFAGSLIYNLDGGAVNRWIELNYALNSGSGSGDMLAFLPVSTSQIAACGPGCDVTVFSSFGQQAGSFANNDGYEEWAAVLANPTVTQTPEVSTLLMALGGLLALLNSEKLTKRFRKS